MKLRFRMTQGAVCKKILKHRTWCTAVGKGSIYVIVVIGDNFGLFFQQFMCQSTTWPSNYLGILA